MKSYDHGDRSKKCIALTFDDGPNPFWTRKILDILEKTNIKATFFVIGKWAERWPDLVAETYLRGHLIGNHTYSHPRHGEGDFEKSENILEKIIGLKPIFIRPPHNNDDLCASFYNINFQRIKIINNDVYSGDWNNNYSDLKIIDNVTKHVEPGSIVLLHDGSQRERDLKDRPEQTYLALPKIITRLKKDGYSFARLDELKFES